MCLYVHWSAENPFPSGLDKTHGHYEDGNNEWNVSYIYICYHAPTIKPTIIAAPDSGR